MLRDTLVCSVPTSSVVLKVIHFLKMHSFGGERIFHNIYKVQILG